MPANQVVEGTGIGRCLFWTQLLGLPLHYGFATLAFVERARPAAFPGTEGLGEVRKGFSHERHRKIASRQRDNM